MHGDGDGLAREHPSRGRFRAFRVIAVIMAASAAGFGLFTAVFGIVGEGQEIHAFHNVIVASLLLVLSAPPAIQAARAPERASAPLLHLVMLAVAALATMAVALTIDVFTLPFVVLTVVLLLLRVPRDRAAAPKRPSLPLTLLVALGVVPLFAYALDQAALQRTDAVSEHAELYHWVETSFYAAAIPFLGALAAARPRAFRLTAWTSGIALALLGAGSLLFPTHASAVDTAWAWVAVAGALLFLGVAEWEARRRAPATA